MADVIELPKQAEPDVRFRELHNYGWTDDGQSISLACGERRDGSVLFAVLLMAGINPGDTFTCLAEYPGDTSGKINAENAANVAAKALVWSELFLSGAA
ncbi:hypothetical protein GCM10019059_32080 [Camelimonas fluminis]|uniref:Uncharacterized protein n=1 Tax=Camelimonas fluminis TaxID=1576911 RepID=A0ABV7UHN0_9HYPH|nr:hypothetical protein [Camelimonas fluminis]GHE69920.1 hypothetical protein GCM10019059_32080 [Camelimonas fluminis]